MSTPEFSISGISAPECECNPHSRAETALEELVGVIDKRQNELGITSENVARIVAQYRCEGPIIGDCVKRCGQIVTASLYDSEGNGLLSGDFMSEVTLEDSSTSK